MAFSAPGLIVGLALFAGVVMAPVRAFQALSGRLLSRSAGAQPPPALLTMLFLFAFLFWFAVIWAGYNIEVSRTCSGDNCIGYMLWAMPFPFVYGWAELLLFRARRSGPRVPPGGGRGPA